MLGYRGWGKHDMVWGLAAALFFSHPTFEGYDFSREDPSRYSKGDPGGMNGRAKHCLPQPAVIDSPILLAEWRCAWRDA